MSSSTDSRAQASSYLMTHHVMTLATIGDDGPDAAAVFYVNRGLDFYFMSSPGSRHCRNARLDPRVSATIQEDYSDWSLIRGIQMSGRLQELGAAESDAARTLFAAKFPDVQAAGASKVVAQAVQKAKWYGLAVARIRFIDNAREFAHRTEWSALEFIEGGEQSRSPGRN